MQEQNCKHKFPDGQCGSVHSPNVWCRNNPDCKHRGSNMESSEPSEISGKADWLPNTPIKPAFTPEPWKCEVKPEYLSEPVISIPIQTSHGQLLISANGIPAKGEMLANARLIAAAPKLYEYVKTDFLIPDCGGDFCFLATEGMENECPEPEEGAGNCKFRAQCRAMNERSIMRQKLLDMVEGK